MSDLDETHVVTCFLRSEGEVLLLRRSRDVGSYAGRWGAVAGHAEGDPDGAARAEIREETGFGDAELVRKGEPFSVDDASLHRRWVVHPYLFDVKRRDPRLNYESAESAWVSPTEILRRDVVPRLWNSYRAVAPTVESVRGDREHGSAYLSILALEVLRNAAAEDEPLPETAAALIKAQPSMAAVRNRVNRAMAELTRSSHVTARQDRDKQRADAQVHDVLRAAVKADRSASMRSADLLSGTVVLTLSRSGTVIEAILAARPQVVIAVSQPGGEGIAVARRLTRNGLEVTLLPDAALAAAPAFDIVMLGCDTLLPDGTVVNKIGSRLAAMVARERGVPVYVATSTDKLLAHGQPEMKRASRSEIGDVPERVHVATDLFEKVPTRLIDRYVTEHGLLTRSDLAGYAEMLQDLAEW